MYNSPHISLVKVSKHFRKEILLILFKTNTMLTPGEASVLGEHCWQEKTAPGPLCCSSGQELASLPQHCLSCSSPAYAERQSKREHDSKTELSGFNFWLDHLLVK